MLKLSQVKNVVVSHGDYCDLECPCCGFLARDDKDQEQIKSSGACTECFTNFRHIYGDSWDNGSRPSIIKSRSKMLWRA